MTHREQGVDVSSRGGRGEGDRGGGGGDEEKEEESEEKELVPRSMK